MYDWMTTLGSHYRSMHARRTGERLMIVFDIDGTILDMRYLVLHMLHLYDREQGTHWFDDLTLTDVNTHENVIGGLLSGRGIPETERDTILEWYYAHYWLPDVTLSAHRPYEGVMHVIRWLQAQPNLTVGLNTGRFEAQRKETLGSLNRLGARFGVQFQNQLLFMRPNNWQYSVPAGKVEGLRRFHTLGYTVIAMLDNEPDNLAAIAAQDHRRELLPMHADTLYLSSRTLLPRHAVAGVRYNPYNLASVAVLSGSSNHGADVSRGHLTYFRQTR